MVGTERGMMTTRTVLRRPDNRRWDEKLLPKVVCTTWEPKKASVSVELARPVRQRYLKYKETPGCPICAGQGLVKGQHTRACRERLETLLAQADQESGGAGVAPPTEEQERAA
eukprot:1739702-Amphidinium_carterae.1